MKTLGFQHFAVPSRMFTFFSFLGNEILISAVVFYSVAQNPRYQQFKAYMKRLTINTKGVLLYILVIYKLFY